MSRASLCLPAKPLHTLKTLPVKDNVLLTIGLMPTQKVNLQGKAEKELREREIKITVTV